MVSDEEKREIAAKMHTARYDFSGRNIALDIGLEGEYSEGYNARHKLAWLRLADLIEPEVITGDTSDGYHTFDELYDHRARLFSVIVRDRRELAWKSMLHHDGTMYDGMFIVGIETPDGQATYHYDVDPYWGIFDCEVLDRAPEWDGHTPRQAIDRIAALGPSCDRDALLALANTIDEHADEMNDGCNFASAGDMRDYARRIREACGVRPDER